MVVPPPRPVVRQRPARVPPLLHRLPRLPRAHRRHRRRCSCRTASSCRSSRPAGRGRGCAATACLRRCTSPAAWSGIATCRSTDRLRLGRALLPLRRADLDDPALDDTTFAAFLRRHGQRDAAIERLWDLICTPTVNLPADEASLTLAATVFQIGLLTDAAAGDIGWSRVPLAELHADPATAALERAGADVRTSAPVERIEVSGGGVVGDDGNRAHRRPTPSSSPCPTTSPPGCSPAPCPGRLAGPSSARRRSSTSTSCTTAGSSTESCSPPSTARCSSCSTAPPRRVWPTVERQRTVPRRLAVGGDASGSAAPADELIGDGRPASWHGCSPRPPPPD